MKYVLVATLTEYCSCNVYTGLLEPIRHSNIAPMGLSNEAGLSVDCGAHRCECLCSASQLWLPHPALCVVPPECFQGLCVWSGAMGSKSGKLQNIADCDSAPLLASRPHETLSQTSLDFLIYRPRLS